ncbi:hypothetical protein U9M48_033027 [Paspalum notatum var. saurae]|uniref:Terpene synthase N-terminal domain-containing protein n=1 Tax=Paspalum notatum var. saurae TaxID=547442 RepID=A0AAQ3U6G9_PASNO
MHPGAAPAKEQEVRRIIVAAAASPDLAAKLELVDVLQRIGVDYHFGKEIDDLLHAVYDGDDAKDDNGDDDLCLISVRFYLLRKHGVQQFKLAWKSMGSQWLKQTRSLDK